MHNSANIMYLQALGFISVNVLAEMSTVAPVPVFSHSSVCIHGTPFCGSKYTCGYPMIAWDECVMRGTMVVGSFHRQAYANSWKEFTMDGNRRTGCGRAHTWREKTAVCLRALFQL